MPIMFESGTYSLYVELGFDSEIITGVNRIEQKLSYMSCPAEK